MLREPDGTTRVEGFLSWLRGVFQGLGGNSPVLIVSGSIGLMPMVQRLGIPDRINYLEPFRLEPWSREASVACFHQLASRTALSIEDGVAGAVYDALGIGIPITYSRSSPGCGNTPSWRAATGSPLPTSRRYTGRACSAPPARTTWHTTRRVSATDSTMRAGRSPWKSSPRRLRKRRSRPPHALVLATSTRVSSKMHAAESLKSSTFWPTMATWKFVTTPTGSRRSYSRTGGPRVFATTTFQSNAVRRTA